MMRRLPLQGVLIGLVILGVIGFAGVRLALILDEYKEIRETEPIHWSMSQRPLYSGSYRIEVLKFNDEPGGLRCWWQGLSGVVDVRLVNDADIAVQIVHGRAYDETLRLDLGPGRYTLAIEAKRFTGAAAIGLDGFMVIGPELDGNYRRIEADPLAGFHWDYLLYVPDEIRAETLLVLPNNTGRPSDCDELHLEHAKRLIRRESGLGDALGVPVLVPVFGRPESDPSLYTHALDRATLLAGRGAYERIDRQLIHMIDDARRRLAKQKARIGPRILISGFSAAGDFADRFSALHPERVIAVFAGGCDTLIPAERMAGERLPYPLGVCDFERVAGEPFDRSAYDAVHRLFVKGVQDEGGFMVQDTEDGPVRTTWKHYYESQRKRHLERQDASVSGPVLHEGDLDDGKLDLIRYRVFAGTVLAERFPILEDQFTGLGVENTRFILYEGVGHEMTDAMRSQRKFFFQEAMDAR